MFSVIIPLYNKADYIEKAVESVLNQSFQGFELIIVNDGSTDNSLEIVQQLLYGAKSRYNNLHAERSRGATTKQLNIINQPNAGVSTARNKGVEAAKNDYIAFLDADDWWDPNYLMEMQQLIKSYPEAGLWSAKYFKVKNGKNIKANIGLENEFENGYINYFKVYSKTMWMPITSSSFIIQKKIFNEFNGFNTNLKLGEDFDLWVKIALKHKIAYLNKPLVFYNQDVDIINRAVDSKKFYEPENNFIYNLGYLKNIENKNPELKKLLDNLRVYNLYKYHVFKKYSNETEEIINQVDFYYQPLNVKLKYKLPVTIIRQYYYFRKFGSTIKTILKKGILF